MMHNRNFIKTKLKNITNGLWRLLFGLAVSSKKLLLKMKAGLSQQSYIYDLFRRKTLLVGELNDYDAQPLGRVIHIRHYDSCKVSSFMVRRVLIVVDLKLSDEQMDLCHRVMNRYPRATCYLWVAIDKKNVVMQQLVRQLFLLKPHALTYQLLSAIEKQPDLSMVMFKNIYEWHQIKTKLSKMPAPCRYLYDLSELTSVPRQLAPRQCFAVSGLWLLMSVFIFHLSYVANVRLLKRISSEYNAVLSLQQYPKQEQVISIMQLFHTTQSLNHDTHFWLKILGLYRANQLLPPATHLLMVTLKVNFYIPMLHILKQRLLQYQQHWPAYSATVRGHFRGGYYADLLAYMDLIYPVHMNAAALDYNLLFLWHKTWALNSSDQLKLIDFYLKNLKKQENDHVTFIDDPLFLSAKNQLELPDNALNVWLAFQYGYKKRLPSLTLNHFFPSNSVLLDQKTISQFYTKMAWHSQISQAIMTLSHQYEDYVWFMQNKDLPDQQKIDDQLLAYYLKAYQQAWVQFIGAIQLRLTNNLLLATQQAASLAKPGSIFYQVLALMSDNYNFSSINNAQAILLQSTAKTLQQINYQSYQQALKQTLIDCHYVLLSQNVLIAAKQLSKTLFAQQSMQYGLAQFAASAKKQASSIEDVQDAHAVQYYLNMPGRLVWHALLENALQDINAIYVKTIYAFYQVHLKSYFPFQLTKRSADPVQLKQWLSPGKGQLWQFVKTQLRPFLIYRKHRWQLQQFLHEGLPVSQQFVSQLNQLWQLANDLFENNQYRAHFYFYPVPQSNVVRVTFSNDQQQYDYQNGPESWQSFLWQPNAFGLHLKILIANHAGAILQSFTPPWGLLRFLQKFSVKNGIATFEGMQPFSLRIRPVSAVSVLQAIQKKSLANNLLTIDSS